MTLVCILHYTDIAEWRVASEVRRYLTETYGPDREEHPLMGSLRLKEGGDEPYRALRITIVLPEEVGDSPEECERHSERLLGFINTWYARFGLRALPPAHIYCYPL